MVLYEMLSGNVPWQSSKDLAVLQQIINWSFVPISPEVVVLNDFLRRLLEKDREKRISNAVEALSIFQKVQREAACSGEDYLLCLRLLRVGLPPVLRAMFLDRWRDAQKQPWSDDEESGRLFVSREHTLSEWPL